MVWERICISGVGLIGGSLGHALKVRKLARHIVGHGRTNQSLEHALAAGAIDSFQTDLRQALTDCQLAIFCQPVDQLAAILSHAYQLAPHGCLLTDVGSTKGFLADLNIMEPRTGVAIVGSHPIAGSEKQGVQAARSDLFEKKRVIITACEWSTEPALATMEQFWQSLGSQTERLTAEVHDALLAHTSHLPHLLASALAGSLPESAWPYCGTGFRDTTRIAAGDPGVWLGILRENKRAVLHSLAQVEARTQAFRQALESNDCDRIETLLREGKQVRDALGS